MGRKTRPNKKRGERGEQPPPPKSAPCTHEVNFFVVISRGCVDKISECAATYLNPKNRSEHVCNVEHPFCPPSCGKKHKLEKWENLPHEKREAAWEQYRKLCLEKTSSSTSSPSSSSPTSRSLPPSSSLELTSPPPSPLIPPSSPPTSSLLPPSSSLELTSPPTSPSIPSSSPPTSPLLPPSSSLELTSPPTSPSIPPSSPPTSPLFPVSLPNSQQTFQFISPSHCPTTSLISPPTSPSLPPSSPLELTSPPPSPLIPPSSPPTSPSVPPSSSLELTSSPPSPSIPPSSPQDRVVGAQEKESSRASDDPPSRLFENPLKCRHFGCGKILSSVSCRNRHEKDVAHSSCVGFPACPHCPPPSDPSSPFSKKSKYSLCKDIMDAVRPLGFLTVSSLILFLLSCLLFDECFEVISDFCASCQRVKTKLSHFFSLSEKRQDRILALRDFDDDQLGELAIQLRLTEGQQEALNEKFELDFTANQFRRWKEARISEADFQVSPSKLGYFIPLVRCVLSMFFGFTKEDWREFDRKNRTKDGKLIIPINLQFDGGSLDKKNGAVLGKVIRGDQEWKEGNRSLHPSLNPTITVLHIKETRDALKLDFTPIYNVCQQEIVCSDGKKRALVPFEVVDMKMEVLLLGLREIYKSYELNMCTNCDAKREGDWDLPMQHHYCPSDEIFDSFAKKFDLVDKTHPDYKYNISLTNDRKNRPRSLSKMKKTAEEIEKLRKDGKRDEAEALSRKTGQLCSPITVVDPQRRISDIIHVVEGVVKRTIKLQVDCIPVGHFQEQKVIEVFDLYAGVTFEESTEQLWTRLDGRRLTCVMWRHILGGFFETEVPPEKTKAGGQPLGPPVYHPGVISACLGNNPDALGLAPEVWCARVEFMVLTYEMFVLLLNPERGLTEEEINEYRILTLKWGQAYSYGKYRENGWTSFCHRFHEHIFWDLLRDPNLYANGCWVIESAVGICKRRDTRLCPFKRPRQGEKVEAAGCRRILGAEWLTHTVAVKNACEDMKLLKIRQQKESSGTRKRKYDYLRVGEVSHNKRCSLTPNPEKNEDLFQFYRELRETLPKNLPPPSKPLPAPSAPKISQKVRDAMSTLSSLSVMNVLPLKQLLLSWKHLFNGPIPRTRAPLVKMICEVVPTYREAYEVVVEAGVDEDWGTKKKIK